MWHWSISVYEQRCELFFTVENNSHLPWGIWGSGMQMHTDSSAFFPSQSPTTTTLLDAINGRRTASWVHVCCGTWSMHRRPSMLLLLWSAPSPPHLQSPSQCHQCQDFLCGLAFPLLCLSRIAQHLYNTHTNVHMRWVPLPSFSQNKDLHKKQRLPWCLRELNSLCGYLSLFLQLSCGQTFPHRHLYNLWRLHRRLHSVSDTPIAIYRRSTSGTQVWHVTCKINHDKLLGQQVTWSGCSSHYTGVSWHAFRVWQVTWFGTHIMKLDIKGNRHAKK